MLKKSDQFNPNYLAKVVKLKGLQKHSNADRLQTCLIDFQNVITDMKAKDGDIYVYFPVECQINKDFLSKTNSFRDKTLNTEPDEGGFFEKHCRVKAMSLRGERSMGYIVPANHVFEWAGVNKNPSDFVNTEFDTINEKLLLKKYIKKVNKHDGPPNKKGKKPALSRLIEGQVHLHVDTDNLRKYMSNIKPSDTISITYKTHGTSWWVSNVLVKKKLNWIEKVLLNLGVKIQTEEYDLVYGSRRVVKNKQFEDPKGQDHFYGYDLWKDIKDEIGYKIPKGFTLYGEMIGYDKEGNFIQKPFDYGCRPGEHKLEVYRITYTNPNGVVMELSTPQIVEFCLRNRLNPSYRYFTGKARDLYPQLHTGEYWHEKFISNLEDDYANGERCFRCNNKVPAEGICLRVERLYEYEIYKLKSFEFLEFETKQLDAGESNIEDTA